MKLPKRSTLAESDEEIISEVQKGSVLAFEQIVKRYQEKLVYFVSRIVSNESQAEEIVQDTFLNIYKSIDRLETSRKFSSYIYVVARNLSISFLRGRKFETNIDKIPIASQESDFVTNLSTKEEKEKLGRSILKLPEKERKALTLFYFDELSYRQIAERLGIPLNTVRTKIRRGKEALKKILENEEK